MKKVQLTDSQIKRFRALWFVYGNEGPKDTLFNHKLIQGFVEDSENRIGIYKEGKKYMVADKGEEYANARCVTDDCIKACEEILNTPNV